jgi:hypothetical protein
MDQGRGRLGRLILHLKHTRGMDNVVADAVSRMFEGGDCETPEMSCVALMQSLPLVSTSLEEHQKQDNLCWNIYDKVPTGKGGIDNFQIYKRLLCFCSKGARSRRWLVPVSLRQMVRKYFHDCVLSGHLGTLKTFQKIARTFYRPKMRAGNFYYVRQCDLC